MASNIVKTTFGGRLKGRARNARASAGRQLQNVGAVGRAIPGAVGHRTSGVASRAAGTKVGASALDKYASAKAKVGSAAHKYGGGADYAKADRAAASAKKQIGSASPGRALARLDISDKLSGKAASSALANLTPGITRAGKASKRYRRIGHAKRYGIPAAAALTTAGTAYGVHKYRKNKKARQEEMFLDPDFRAELQEALFNSYTE